MSAKPIDEEIELIHFYYEDVQFDFFLPQDQVSQWIKKVIERAQKKLLGLNFIFCSDAYLLRINQEYLEHDTFTDIITFPLANLPEIEGDIFISFERVVENAKKFEVPVADELHRVIIHGVLHLCGFGDKTEQEAALMRQKENETLALLS